MTDLTKSSVLHHELQLVHDCDPSTTEVEIRQERGEETHWHQGFRTPNSRSNHLMSGNILSAPCHHSQHHPRPWRTSPVVTWHLRKNWGRMDLNNSSKLHSWHPSKWKWVWKSCIRHFPPTFLLQGCLKQAQTSPHSVTGSILNRKQDWYHDYLLLLAENTGSWVSYCSPLSLNIYFQ